MIAWPASWTTAVAFACAALLVVLTAAAAPAAVPSYLDVPRGASRSVDLPQDASDVLVGNPALADVSIASPRRLYIIGRETGLTNIFVLGSGGNEIARIELSVSIDGRSIRAALHRALPEERSIEVAVDGDIVTLMGTASSDGTVGRAARIARRFVETDDQIVNLLTVNREQQVLIQVRVAEVQRTVLKEIGITANFTDSPGGTIASRGLLKGNDFAGALFYSGIQDVMVQLRLLEERGLVRNLAEPNLVAVSGETASMLAGGEYPIPVPDDDGIKIEFKPFGVTLSFLPVVLDSGRINLKLSTEVSALSNTNTVDWVLANSDRISINSFTVRRASSTVELPDGGSLMIAGLIQNDILSGLSGVPGVMDLPIIGQLFRSDSFRRNESELVVIVNASLVRPTAPDTLRSPTDAISPGGDLDRWLMGRILGHYAPGFVQDTHPGQRHHPPFGFTIDEAQP